MSRCFYGKQFGAGGDFLERCFHFIDGAEGIACAVYEEGRRAKPGKVLRAELVRFARRVERIREQQEGFGEARF